MNGHNVFFLKSKNSVSSRLLAKISVSRVFWDPICGALAACFGVLGACDLTRLSGHAKAWVITLVFIQTCFFPEGPNLTDPSPDAACQCLHLQGIYSFGALGRFHLSPSPPRPMGPQGFMGLLLSSWVVAVNWCGVNFSRNWLRVRFSSCFGLSASFSIPVGASTRCLGLVQPTVLVVHSSLWLGSGCRICIVLFALICLLYFRCQQSVTWFCCGLSRGCYRLLLSDVVERLAPFWCELSRRVLLGT